MRHEPVRSAFGLDLIRCLAKCQRLGLCENIRQQDVVMLAQRIQWVTKPNKVARDEPSTLVNELIERVLAVGTRFTPVNWAGLIVDPGPPESDVFAVALHRQLLEVSGKSLQVLL